VFIKNNTGLPIVAVVDTSVEVVGVCVEVVAMVLVAVSRINFFYIKRTSKLNLH